MSATLDEHYDNVIEAIADSRVIPVMGNCTLTRVLSDEEILELARARNT